MNTLISQFEQIMLNGGVEKRDFTKHSSEVAYTSRERVEFLSSDDMVMPNMEKLSEHWIGFAHNSITENATGFAFKILTKDDEEYRNKFGKLEVTPIRIRVYFPDEQQRYNCVVKCRPLWDNNMTPINTFGY